MDIPYFNVALITILKFQWQCCGVKDFMDYKNSTFLKVTGNKIKGNATMSWSCCAPSTTIEDALSGDGEMVVDPLNRGNKQY